MSYRTANQLANCYLMLGWTFPGHQPPLGIHIALTGYNNSIQLAGASI